MFHVYLRGEPALGLEKPIPEKAGANFACSKWVGPLGQLGQLL